MKYKLPILSAVLAAILLPMLLAAQQSARKKQAKPVEFAAPSGEGFTGQQLVQQAAHVAVAQPKLEARIRQRVRMFDHELAATGQYRQWFDGRSILLRLDLKTQIAGQTASFLQISDGNFFWTHRSLPGEQSLQHIHLRQISEACAEYPQLSESLNDWALLGGLPHLLESLDQNFQFQPAIKATIGGQQIPVWQLKGSWKPDQFQRQFPQWEAAFRSGKWEEIPRHLPQEVQLVLGRDRVFPLFPYRIVYLRDGSPLVELEWHDLHRPTDMDPRIFEYNAGNQKVHDATEEWIENKFRQLGIEVPDEPSE